MDKGASRRDLVFDTALSGEREAYLEERIVEFNRTHCEVWEQNHDTRYEAAPLHVYALDRQGEVVGGLVGRTHSLRAWLEIGMIWVAAAARGQGIGRELMRMAEEEALRRGCLYARTSTSDYQAPRFYEKLGYALYGELAACPPGVTCYYYRKDLAQNE